MQNMVEKMTPKERQYKAAIRRVLSHYKLSPGGNRWPCIECDRPGPDAPLRINIIRTEDGNEYRLGCSHCNGVELMQFLEDTLNG